MNTSFELDDREEDIPRPPVSSETPKVQHVYGLRGFGHSLDDRCPACEAASPESVPETPMTPQELDEESFGNVEGPLDPDDYDEQLRRFHNDDTRPLSSSASEITEAIDVLIHRAKRCANINPLPTFEPDLAAARSKLETLFREQQEEIERLKRFETYVFQVIAMGNQAELTVESLPK